MADRHILSLDWDPRELRIVHARIRKDQVRVLDVLAVSIPREVNVGDAEQMGHVLRDALRQERISTRRVIIDIPRDQAVLNTLTLPKVSVSDLAGMVQLQIGKGLPFATAEAVIDFAVPPDDGEADKVEVLVGAVRSDVVDYYRKICQVAGLKLERAGLRPYANRMAIAHFLSGQLPERVLVVDVGPSLTEIDVLRRGQLVFSRAASVYVPSGDTVIMSIDRGSRTGDLEAPDENPPEPDDQGVSIVPFRADTPHRPGDTAGVVADLMVEVTRSIEAYRGTDAGAEMDCAVVAGGTGVEEALAEAIQRRFNINAETYNPASCLEGDAQKAADAAGFSAALGLVLGHAAQGGLHFDFLNPKKPEAPGQARLKRVPMVAGVAAVFVLAATTFYIKGPAKQFARVAELEEQIQEAKDQIKANKKFMAMIESVEQFEADQVVWVDELRNLIDVLPDNKKVVLSKVDMYQNGKRLEIGLRSKTGQQAPRIVDNFEVFRPEDDDEPYYRASRGTTSVGRGDYKHESTISVHIVNGDTKSKKKSKHNKRRG